MKMVEPIIRKFGKYYFVMQLATILIVVANFLGELVWDWFYVLNIVFAPVMVWSIIMILITTYKMWRRE